MNSRGRSNTSNVRGPAGVPVDASSGPTVDPTKNVLDLVQAAVRRLDDLATADRRYYDAEVGHVKALAALREVHQEKMARAESARIDSIRQVDVLATATTGTQALTAIQTLAASTAASAETLRVAVANTATSLASQLAATVAEVNKRLATLEQSSYEGMGKQKIADPQMERLAVLVEKLATAQTSGAGKTAGSNATWAAVGAIIMLLLALAGFFGLRGATPHPEIRYLPQPATQTAPAAPR